MDAIQKKRIEKKAKWMQGHDFLDFFFQKHTVARLLASNFFLFLQKEKG